MKIVMILIFFFIVNQDIQSQQIEVQGELKVTQMIPNDNQDNLVIHNPDGTLGTRSVASLPLPPPPIDTSRNLASDYELAKQLCDCPNLPPFMIQKLLDSGYTQEDLIGAGVNVQEVIDAQRMGILVDTRDHKSYKTVTIGTQTWMAENLNIGTRINVGVEQTNNNYIEKYCYSDLDFFCNTFGGLYQWNELMKYNSTEGGQGICPTGWHVPTDTEWKTLEIYLGMTPAEADIVGFRGGNQGSQMADNVNLWDADVLTENGLFGSSGFMVLPGGTRNQNGSYNAKNDNGFFFSSTENSSGNNAYFRGFSTYQTNINRFHTPKNFGFSVRCLKD